MKRIASIASPRARREGGFSIIELMIAVALGLIILAALTTYFVQTSANRREMERNTRQIENGRFAIDMLREDVALAGFYADLAPGVTPDWKTNDACPVALANLGFALAPAYSAPVPVFGYALGSGAPAACLQGLVPDNDVLVVRRFGTDAVTPAVAGNSQNAARWFIQISECAEDDPLVPFVTATGASTGSFSLKKLACGGTLADVWSLREQVYYVRDCSVCAPTSDGIPTLWRLTLDPGGANVPGYPMKAEPLVEGIEAMRVEYGIDTSGDGTPDAWSRCEAAAPCDATAWSNVTAVRVYILSRNLEASPGHVDGKTYALGLWGDKPVAGDGYKRHVYSATISMPNRTGPREPQLAVAP